MAAGPSIEEPVMIASEGRFSGKVVAITGAAHGIGAATARRFLREGARVAAIDREDDGFAESLQGTAAERLLTMAGDCTDAAVLADFHARSVASFGPVDVLFNNVGQSARERAGPFHESEEEVWRFVLESRCSPRCGCRGWSCRPCASVAGASSTCRATQPSSAMPA
jgi:acetoacetyl-CoA reductase/3-oxoacyl-[acyl-carrier protein] reductase